MGKYNVQLLLAAYTDLDEIFDYLLVYNQHAAEKTLDKIMNSLRALRIHRIPVHRLSNVLLRSSIFV